jgi:glucan phosphoethanolaminetransferase (alkaline phosphatase superfamily)
MVIALFKKEIKTIKPVLITLSPVFFWSLIVGIINLIFYICWYKAFIHFYTNIIILIVIGIAMIQCLLQIGNSEMQNYADNLIDKYKLKED